jgi:hypothetical protein
MATRDKSGNWTYTEDEEQEIAIGAEVRYRAARRLRDEERIEKQKQHCANGNHVAKDGKCEHCGVEVKPEKPAATRRLLR